MSEPIEEFEVWWQESGQYGRAGGGNYEKSFAWNAWQAARSTPMAGAEPPKQGGATKCRCQTCAPITLDDMRMVLCAKCGNKRCPHANDHRNECTGSNEPGQPGSAYPTSPSVEPAPAQQENDHLRPPGGEQYDDERYAKHGLTADHVCRMWARYVDQTHPPPAHIAKLIIGVTADVYAALAQSAHHQEPGWVRVPLVPTNEMLNAVKTPFGERDYAALLAASPKEPKP